MQFFEEKLDATAVDIFSGVIDWLHNEDVERDVLEVTKFRMVNF